MSWLLDTNACIHFLNGSSRSLVARVAEAGPSRLAVSTITAAELHFGAARSARPRANAERVAAFLAELNVESFTSDCASAFGDVKASALRIGRPMSDFDLALAATALVLGRALVTDDAAFRRVKGLSVESWT